MKYPEFNLEKALAGEPVVVKVGGDLKKCWLTACRNANDSVFIEMIDSTGCVVGVCITKVELREILIGMWVEPAEFKHWDAAHSVEYVTSAPDVSALVEALESAYHLIANHSGETLPTRYASDQMDMISAALAAHRSPPILPAL